MLALQETPRETIFHETQMLKGSEVREVRDAVEGLRSAWHCRFPGSTFYTLGMSSYLDAATPETREVYYQGSRIANPIMWRRLDWLYRRLQHRLSVILDAPVRYRPDCALPGFHIFIADPTMKYYDPSIHVDVQYTNLNWGKHEKPDFDRTVSFTLSLTLPRQGAGLKVWEDRHRDQVWSNTRAEFMAKVGRAPTGFHAYSEGSMVVHSGHLVHQMALGDILEEGERVTVQGHGVWCDGVWQLYW